MDKKASAMLDKTKGIGLSILVAVLIGVPLYWLESTHLQYFNVDWNIAFYPATRLLLQGQNPYSVTPFHNPVWALLPLIPLVLLGQRTGGLLLFFFSLFSYTFLGFHFKAKPLALIALLLSPLMFYNLFLGNIDALVLWGLLLPPPIGLFLVAIKPQIGIGISIYLAYSLWRESGWRGLLLGFAPVTVALVLSFLLFGNWMANPAENVVTAYWNLSLFPWSLPIGLALLVIALRRRKLTVSISAAPFLAPYLSLGSWSVALMGLLENNLAMVTVVSGLWLLYALHQFVR